MPHLPVPDTCESGEVTSTQKGLVLPILNLEYWKTYIMVPTINL